MKTNRIKYKNGVLALALSLVWACSSNTSSEVTRDVTGNVASETTAALKRNFFSRLAFALDESSDCFANTIIATDVSGNTTTATVDDSCDFTLSLTVDTAYILSFTQGDTFVATLIFDSGLDGYTSSNFNLSSDATALDLGLITLSGNIATPLNNPLEQCDRDHDGVFDLNDDDDDDDGVFDHEERDCDFDGYLDDDDNNNEEDDLGEYCALSEGEFITRIKPYEGDNEVDLDKDIKIYTTCPIDDASVTADTFLVEDEEGNALACAYSVSNDDNHHTVKCEHDESPFSSNTDYSVTISGLLCEDTTAIEGIVWSFSTESEDDDDGDDEDELDDDDLLEGDEDDSDDEDDDSID